MVARSQLFLRGSTCAIGLFTASVALFKQMPGKFGVAFTAHFLILQVALWLIVSVPYGLWCREVYPVKPSGWDGSFPYWTFVDNFQEKLLWAGSLSVWYILQAAQGGVARWSKPLSAVRLEDDGINLHMDGVVATSLIALMIKDYVVLIGQFPGGVDFVMMHLHHGLVCGIMLSPFIITDMPGVPLIMAAAAVAEAGTVACLASELYDFFLTYVVGMTLSNVAILGAVIKIWTPSCYVPCVFGIAIAGGRQAYVWVLWQTRTKRKKAVSAKAS